MEDEYNKYWQIKTKAKTTLEKIGYNKLKYATAPNVGVKYI